MQIACEHEAQATGDSAGCRPGAGFAFPAPVPAPPWLEKRLGE